MRWAMAVVVMSLGFCSAARVDHRLDRGRAPLIGRQVLWGVHSWLAPSKS
jgi:hypothetical protein